MYPNTTARLTRNLEKIRPIRHALERRAHHPLLFFLNRQEVATTRLSKLIREGRRVDVFTDAMLNQTTKHSYTTLGVLLMVAQPSWLRAQARGLCHQDFLSGTVPISCGSI